MRGLLMRGLASRTPFALISIRMVGFRRVVFQDFGTKVLALILALAVYVHVFSGQEREMVYHVPLQLSPLPAGLATASEIPSQVKVRVHASGKDLLKLRTQRFQAEIRLDTRSAGTLQRPILGSDVKLPWGIRNATVEVIEPQALELVIEKITSASLPVKVRTRGSLPTARVLSARPDAEPPKVRVSGPASVLAAAESVATEPVDLDDLRGAYDRDVRLVAPPGLMLEADHVRVRMEAVEGRLRITGEIPVELIGVQGDAKPIVRPEVASVLIGGPASALDKIDLRAIRVVADFRRRNPRSLHVALRPIVPGLTPASVIAVQCRPESVTVLP